MIELSLLALAAAVWVAGKSSEAKARARAEQFAAAAKEACIRRVSLDVQLGLMRAGRFEDAAAFPARLRAAVAMKEAQLAAASRGRRG